MRAVQMTTPLPLRKTRSAALQEKCGLPKAQRDVQRPPQQGSERERGSEGKRARGAAPRLQRSISRGKTADCAHRPERKGTGERHLPNADVLLTAAAATLAAPKSPQTQFQTLNYPSCYVSQGQRTASGARPLCAGVVAKFFSPVHRRKSWRGWGENNNNKKFDIGHAQYRPLGLGGGPKVKGKVVPVLRLAVEKGLGWCAAILSQHSGGFLCKRKSWGKGLLALR